MTVEAMQTLPSRLFGLDATDMDVNVKRTSEQTLGDVQAANQQWWTSQTMSYDWNDKIKAERFSADWFDEVDRRLIFGHRLFAHSDKPFGRIIPLERLAGKRVLEIGCGMGLHTEHLARAGAELTSIDISQTSVGATRKRFELKGLKGDIRHMDAQRLEFADDSFDFVWSWGVIHHSAMTGPIVRNIHRVLRPGGETRVMVYNLEGMPAYLTMLRSYMFGFWRGRSLDEYLWRDTDGFTARYYSKDQLRDLFNTFFTNVAVVSQGQDADAVPLPRYLRPHVLRMMGDVRAAKLANARGSFLSVTAEKPR
jgi:2-polyprenyl-3-methyl-5-hydroxy-6-metoxy-1,4-benzoquinol methylase